MTRIKLRIGSASLALALLACAQANAASIVYTLDRADGLPDGNSYVQVTVSDGAAGAIDFEVRLLPALDGMLTPDAGLRVFSFNVAPGSDAYWKNISGLPEDWKARHGTRTPFGIFDIRVFGKQDAVTDVLTFSIDGVDGDTIQDYASLSFGPAPEGHSFFAARVMEGVPDSTTFGTLGEASSVPLPPALWLLGSAMGMMGVFSRKQQARPQARR